MQCVAFVFVSVCPRCMHMEQILYAGKFAAHAQYGYDLQTYPFFKLVVSPRINLLVIEECPISRFKIDDIWPSMKTHQQTIKTGFNTILIQYSLVVSKEHRDNKIYNRDNVQMIWI